MTRSLLTIAMMQITFLMGGCDVLSEKLWPACNQAVSTTEEAEQAAKNFFSTPSARRDRLIAQLRREGLRERYFKHLLEGGAIVPFYQPDSWGHPSFGFGIGPGDRLNENGEYLLVWLVIQCSSNVFVDEVRKMRP